MRTTRAFPDVSSNSSAFWRSPLRRWPPNRSLYLGAGLAARPRLAQRAQDRVSSRIAEQIAEDEARGGLAVLPHGERGLDVHAVDLARAVEQRIDQRQPKRLRFRARRDSAEQARLSRRQARIDLAPQLLGAVGQGRRARRRGRLSTAQPGPLNQFGQVHIVTAERQHLAAANAAEQEAVGVPIRHRCVVEALPAAPRW